ncbi:hypothetical protein CDAR_531521 [Caerostris darwini]|uniref:Uncharacterized protein n=1 Tax=Caerostris darwini TaxID=1538125 RepID=A0AAV4QZM1_9ARAC|nr:hypothetical protein CDAR_531521 [Caerostris darwini]
MEFEMRLVKCMRFHLPTSRCQTANIRLCLGGYDGDNLETVFSHKREFRFIGAPNPCSDHIPEGQREKLGRN